MSRSPTLRCRVSKQKTLFCPRTWPSHLCGGCGWLLAPSLHFFPFLLAPTASRLRLPDEYLKAWILCSLMNIDGCWLPATVVVPLRPSPGTDSRVGSGRVGISGVCRQHPPGGGDQDACAGEGTSKGCPRCIAPEDSAFSPQNTCFLPKSAGVEQSPCWQWSSRRSWHPGQGWSWDHPWVGGHAVPTHPHLLAPGATLAHTGRIIINLPAKVAGLLFLELFSP